MKKIQVYILLFNLMCSSLPQTESYFYGEIPAEQTDVLYFIEGSCKNNELNHIKKCNAKQKLIASVISNSIKTIVCKQENAIVKKCLEDKSESFSITRNHNNLKVRYSDKELNKGKPMLINSITFNNSISATIEVSYIDQNLRLLFLQNFYISLTYSDNGPLIPHTIDQIQATSFESFRDVILPNFKQVLNI